VQTHPSSAPSPGAFAGGILEVDNLGEASKQGVHAFSQGSSSFAVDHSDVMDAFSQAFIEVFREQFADLRRAKRVEVEFRSDRDSVCFMVHGLSLMNFVSPAHHFSLCKRDRAA